MFLTLEEVINYYKNDNDNKNEIIYKTFEENTKNDIELCNSFNVTDGYGELAFSWNWKLLIDSMPNTFKFLEIGVYKGRVLSQIGFLANRTKKEASIYGITPLTNAGDKYSVYNNYDYLNEIYKNYNYSKYNPNNLKIIKGFSQDKDVIEIANESAPYDIIFIDGSHDYNDVVEDLKNYTKNLKINGYLIMDDASLYIKNPYGKFLGHPDVSKAAIEIMDKDPNFIALYAIGHDRVWQKIIA